MSFSISPNLPANVVEIGNELSQARLDAINNGVAPTSGNPFTTVSYVSGLGYLTTSSASATYATKASPTFTGTVTIPAGASISGYLTTSSASAIYQTLSGMSSYATTTWVGSNFASKFDPATGTYPAVYDVPNDGVEYVRKNQSWVTATGGGGGGGVAWGAITGTVTDQTDLTTYIGGLGYQTASDVSTYVTSLNYQTATDVSTYVTGLNYLTAKTVYTAGSTYTLVAGDQNKIIFMNGGMSGNTLTVPADSTYAFPNGTEITVVCDLGSGTNQVSGQYAGQPVFNGNSAWSVTITNPVSKLVKVATDTWYYY